jgi:hypothetical protein
MVGEKGNLLSSNMFAYVSNNPVTMKDPSGYAATKAMFLPIVAIGAFAVASLIVIHNAVNSFVDQAVKNYNNWKTINKLNKANSDGASSNGNEVVDAGKPGSKSWNSARKKIKDSTGKGINVKVRNQEDAEKLINEARPNLDKRPTYEANPPKAGYEVHPIDNDYNMPHIKWRDWSNGKANGADGHIFWDN